MTTAAYRNAVIERCALVAEGADKTDRNWVPGSFWDTLAREAGARIRALKTLEPFSTGVMSCIAHQDEAASCAKIACECFDTGRLGDAMRWQADARWWSAEARARFDDLFAPPF